MIKDYLKYRVNTWNKAKESIIPYYVWGLVVDLENRFEEEQTQGNSMTSMTTDQLLLYVK